MNALIALEKKLTAVLEFLLKVGMIVITALVFVVAALRFTIHASILWAPEVALILFIYCSSIGSALMIVHRQHIRISYFMEKFFSKKAQRVIDVIDHILIAIINCGFIALCPKWISATGYYVSVYTGFPLSLSQIAVPIGCALVVLYSIYTVLLICLRPDVYYAGVEDEISLS